MKRQGCPADEATPNDMTIAPMPSLLAASPCAPEAANAPTSGIVEVVNYGRGREGLIPLWVGEGDLPTPAFISEAANALACRRRDLLHLAARHSGARARRSPATIARTSIGQPSDPERFYVTSGGMHGDADRGAHGRRRSATRCWSRPPPGRISSPRSGSPARRPVRVPMSVDRQRLASRPRSARRARSRRAPARSVVNSPANPTGWTATREELHAILDLARRHGLWIIADEIYGRFVYDRRRVGRARRRSTTSWTDDDRILFVQTFSKNWAMTGWRIGWLEAPPSLGQVIENLVQYSTSGVAGLHPAGAASPRSNRARPSSPSRSSGRAPGREIVGRLAGTRPCRVARARRRLLRFFSR